MFYSGFHPIRSELTGHCVSSNFAAKECHRFISATGKSTYFPAFFTFLLIKTGILAYFQIYAILTKHYSPFIT
jgi:hypothetical protein